MGLHYQDIDVIGVPLDHGAGRRGVGMGPSAMRIAGLHRNLQRLGYQVRDHGDLNIKAPETEQEGSRNLRFLGTVTKACSELAESVQSVHAEGGLPLVIGGDHSIAIGSISGVAADIARRNGGKPAPEKLAVIWFDAHADINTESTSPSGNIHGMPISCLLGVGPPELTSIGYPGPKLTPDKIVQIGLRDIDDEEKKLIRDFGINVFTMEDIDRRGIHAVIQEALFLTMEDTEFLHVSFDIDAVDPSIAPGTGTTKQGGLTYREAHYCLESIATTGRMTSFELVEVNPILDTQNKTAEIAVGLVGSALGKRIL